MEEKQLLITFDYELFLGNRSGNINDCLFVPTDKVLKVIEKYNAKAIFFVDTTYLLTLKENSHRNQKIKQDFDKVCSHVASLIERGHYVYPHLHPHWLDAEYLEKTNEWRLKETTHYRFHHCSPQQMEYVFDGSIRLLYEIIKPVNASYKIDTYRAGGWCIQPFENFLPFFKKHEFKYDMSVLGGFYLFSNAQYFDFSSAPQKNAYRFSDDVVKENANGAFTEFNISSIYINAAKRFAEKFFLKVTTKVFNDHSYHRGEGQIAIKLDKEKFTSPLTGHDILDSNWERVAIELLSQVKLPTYLKFFNNNKYMHFISHPKMLTNHNIKTFDAFLLRSFSKYNVETDFKKMPVL